jgi:hypothetical protein
MGHHPEKNPIERHPDLYVRSEARVITLLVVAAVIWLVLLAVTLGMLHIATNTPTPRRDAAPPLTLVSNGLGAPDRRMPSRPSPYVAATPGDAA